MSEVPLFHSTAPRSLPTVREGSFPCSMATMGRCDSLTVISPRFVSFAWRYRGASAVGPRSALDPHLQARGIPSGTARAEMALRAKAVLAHPSPIKPVSGALSGGAKMALRP
jgi:hypothetical protein